MQHDPPLPLTQLLARALDLHRGGRLQEAQAAYAQVLALQPRHFDALHLSGVLAAQSREFERAERLLAAAVEANPRDPVARNNHGNVLKELGRHDAALRSYDAALALAPDYVACRFNLAVALQEARRLDDAVAEYDRLVALSPDHAEAHGNRGIALAALGRPGDAIASYERAIALRPGDARLHGHRGLALHALGRFEDAVGSYDRAIALQPGDAAAHANRGAALQQLQRLQDALAAFDSAIEIDPGDAELHYNRGVALQELAQPAAAGDSYRQALRLRPDFALARWALAFIALPPVYAAGEDPAAARASFAEALDQLDRAFAPPATAGAHEAVATRRPFYLSYQEADNRPLLAKYGALCHRLMSDWQQAQAIRPAPPAPAGRVRVGIVSSNVCAHSVWTAIVRGLVLHLDPARFELQVFHLGATQDDETRLARSRAAVFIDGPRSLAGWAEAIVRLRPEVLLYPEVGMHGLTSQLAALRLAPVQAAMWGHPETSGLPTIDYFVSGEALEPDGAQAFYSERLLMLPGLGCHYGRPSPEPSPTPFAGVDLPANGPLFVCPGTTFKYMPEHDGVAAEIARRLGGGTFVYFSQQPRWTALLKERLRVAFAARGLDVEAHVIFAPWMQKSGFYALLRRADVFLDTIGFSGFNTAMQAVECGLPVVTRRGRFMRGRLAAAILARMGIEELVAATDEDYVQLAVRLAADAGYRQRMRDAIAARRQVLFDDLAPIRALQQWMLGLCRPPAGEAAAPRAAARAATIASTVPAHDRRRLP